MGSTEENTWQTNGAIETLRLIAWFQCHAALLTQSMHLLRYWRLIVQSGWINKTTNENCTLQKGHDKIHVKQFKQWIKSSFNQSFPFLLFTAEVRDFDRSFRRTDIILSISATTFPLESNISTKKVGWHRPSRSASARTLSITSSVSRNFAVIVPMPGLLNRITAALSHTM